MKNKKVLKVLAVIVFAYLFSYVLIRNYNTKIIEIDGCPREGCSRVSIPQGTFYSIYSPLMRFDERVTHAEFIATN
jgi:hypothetical protein